MNQLNVLPPWSSYLISTKWAAYQVFFFFWGGWGSQWGIFFPIFARQANRWSSTRGLSQIWLEVREKSRFFFANLGIYCRHTRTKGLNMASSTFFSLEMWLLWAFFPKKSFEQVDAPFFYQQVFQRNTHWWSSQGELAKFGYRSEMKLGNLRILLYFGYLFEPIA
jgi:hypothetical protein